MSVPYLDAAPSLEAFSANVLGQGRPKFEKAIYYRAPKTRTNGKGATFKHDQADWIVVRGNNDNTMLTMMRKGYQPLSQFGTISNGPKGAPSAFDLYDKWGPILTHPDGPRQFPLSQIMAFGWYRPENVPVPGVKFAALSRENLIRELGEPRIIEYLCPECEARRFLRANHLGRHLKVSHDYDRAELIALARDKNWSFSKDLTGDRIERSFEFGDEPETASAVTAPQPEPDFELVTDESPTRDETRPTCPECGGPRGEKSKRCRDCHAKALKARGTRVAA